MKCNKLYTKLCFLRSGTYQQNDNYLFALLHFFCAKQRRVKLVVFILFLAVSLFGMVLRTSRAEKELPFFGDTDRDVLVAKHIVLNREFTDAYPAALGGRGLLKNSPHYFNFLAVLYFLGRSPELVAFILALLSSLNVPLSFWAGRVAGGNRLGLAVAFLTATNWFLVISGPQIYQPHILVTIATAAVCFMIIGVGKKSVVALSSAAFLFPLGLHFHYSVLPALVPVFFILFLIAFQSKKTHHHVPFSLLPLIIFLAMSTFWLYTINQIKPIREGLIEFLQVSYSEAGNAHFFTNNLSARASIFFDALFINTYGFGLFFSVSVICILLVAGFTAARKSNERKLSFLVLALFISILGSLLSEQIYESYYSPYYFLFIFMSAYAIYLITLRRHVLLFICVIMLMAQFGMKQIWFKYALVDRLAPPDQQHVSTRQSIRNAVNIILADATASGFQPEEISILDKSSFYTGLGWIQPAYYYTLEEITGKSLVSINTTFYGIAHNNIRPKYIPKVYYLVCTEDYLETRSSDQVLKDCIDSFWAGAADEGFYRDYYHLTVEMVGVKTFDPILVAGNRTVIYRFDRK